MIKHDTKEPHETRAHDETHAHEKVAQESTASATPSPSGRDSLAVLVPIAKDQALTLANLFQLYAHDFTDYLSLELREDGSFGPGPGNVWWTDGHFPYFIRSRGKLVGFALAWRGSRVTKDADVKDTDVKDADVMDVAEFFVIRSARRRGVGAAAAQALFAAFPGKWEVRVHRTNVPARNFWVRTIAGITGATLKGEAFLAKGVERDVFRFCTK